MKEFFKSTTGKIVVATFDGILFGSVVGSWAGNLAFIGTIFIRLIQMSVIVLVMSSVISAIGEMGKEKAESARMGFKLGFNTFKWIIIFTVISAAVGYLLSIIIQPGVGMIVDEAYVPDAELATAGIQETLTNFVSTNIFSSMANGDMVPIIIFSILLGAALNSHVKRSESHLVLNFVKEINEITLLLIQLVMKVAPIGIFCLLADVSGTIGLSVVVPMIKYLGILLIGVIIMMSFMTVVVSLRCKINPVLLPKKFAAMSLMALTTTSSAITFPTALKDCIEKFGVRKDVANFTMSIGMTMGSSGAAMCYVVMLMFMQQASGITLATPALILGIFLSVMLTLGTITVPGGSVVVATFLATSVGLPLESIALIIGVDWFAGMFRTVLNVDNDVFVAMLAAESIDALDKEIYHEEKSFEETFVERETVKN
ncbi:dicarboxylate/amino acid:cation symporter [Enterococcus sp. AZ109]|uniref:dicarboxylate/amino acid:cation symporter n=1 Tax=Enterococcus sp. AZ109 TaxID=2774634 RepID=UPI003F285A3D